MKKCSLASIASLAIALVLAVADSHASDEVTEPQKNVMLAAASNEAALAEFKKAIRAKYDLKEKAFFRTGKLAAPVQ